MWLSYLLFVLGAIFVAYFIVAICNSLGEFFREDWNDFIAPEVERYHQRQMVRRQHTTCEGCTYLQDKKSCHDRQDPFAAASPLEGEARYCYRKQFWRGKR